MHGIAPASWRAKHAPAKAGVPPSTTMPHTTVKVVDAGLRRHDEGVRSTGLLCELSEILGAAIPTGAGGKHRGRAWHHRRSATVDRFQSLALTSL